MVKKPFDYHEVLTLVKGRFIVRLMLSQWLPDDGIFILMPKLHTVLDRFSYFIPLNVNDGGKILLRFVKVIVPRALLAPQRHFVPALVW